jgi:hypothetical protein
MNPLTRRMAKLEQQLTPPEPPKKWRQVIWHPDRESEPVPAEGENLIIWEIVSPPERPEAVL